MSKAESLCFLNVYKDFRYEHDKLEEKIDP